MGALHRAVGNKPLRMGLWLLVYVASGKFGLQLATLNASATPFWPPTGVALAALLLEGVAAWPLILAGAFLVNVTTAGGLLSSVGIAAGNTLEAVFGALLVCRSAGGARGLWEADKVFRFACAVGAASLASATIGVTVLCLSNLAVWTDYQAIWATWWLGDVTGAMIFAPFILVWFGGADAWRIRPRLPEMIAFVMTFLVLAEFVFGSYSPYSRNNYPTAFVFIPFVFWAGFRFGVRGTTAMAVVLCPIVIWQTLRGLGPFVRGDSNSSLLMAQAFDATLVLTSITIAAVVRERARMAQNLRDARLDAEQKVQERTADLMASNQTLQQARRDLETLSARLLRAQDEERRRIARELHDSAGQLAAALSIELERLRAEESRLTPAGANALADVTVLSEEISREVRTLSYLLHPPLLDEFGLVPAVRWYAEGFSRRSGIAVDLQLDEQMARLPADIETAAFRIVQESLTNIHLHAGGTLATIRVERDSGGALKLQVSDNGKGIDGDRLQVPGVGISGMRERVKTLGGQLQISSAPQQGTTVTARIPAVVEDQARA